ncbi:hypothetical protein DSECCO2_365750 [anaerobic digester metagenome]
MVVKPWQIDHGACTCALYLGDAEAKAVQAVTLAQETVVIAHVYIFNLLFTRIFHLGDDLDLVCSLCKNKILEPVSTWLEIPRAKYRCVIDENLHRGGLDQYDAILKLVAFGTSRTICIVLFKGESEIGIGSGYRAEVGPHVAEAESMVRFNKVIEAVPASGIENRSFRREREVEVQPDAQQGCPIGYRERDKLGFDLGEIRGIVHHRIEAQGTCQGKFGRFENDGTAHAILLPAVDGGSGDTHRALGHICNAEIQIHGKFDGIVAGIDSAASQIVQR